MLMLACETCGGFPSFNAATGGVLACCYLADIAALNIWSEDRDGYKTAAAQWDLTTDHREAKWAEYAAAKRAFAWRKAPVIKADEYVLRVIPEKRGKKRRSRK